MHGGSGKFFDPSSPSCGEGIRNLERLKTSEKLNETEKENNKMVEETCEFKNWILESVVIFE